jgi:integrase
MSIHWDKPNQRWRYQFDRYVDGRRRRASRLLPKGWTQAQADAYDRKEGARQYAIAAGVASAGSPLISTAVKHYLADKTKLKSFEAARENLNQIAWAYMGKTFADLADVAQAVDKAREGVRDGVILSDATVKQRLALLRAACRWGWKKHGMGEHDPTTRMQLPSVSNERHVYVGRAEIGRLVRLADRKDVRAMILVAFYTGMRLGELFKVEARDGALILADTKNGTRRVIPAHPRVKPLLGYLPLTASRNTLTRAWERARRAAGLEHVHFHDLRHSAASEMVNAGVDLFTVGRVLGHKDQRSTARYSHHRDETLAAAVGKIGQKSPHKGAAEGKKKATG